MLCSRLTACSPCAVGRTRRKDAGSPDDADVDPGGSHPGGAPAPPGSAGDGEAWRGSLEHPLSAATSAIMHMHAASDDGAPTSAAPLAFSEYEYKTDKLGELWP